MRKLIAAENTASDTVMNSGFSKRIPAMRKITPPG
jgi:hypothetical protein